MLSAIKKPSETSFRFRTMGKIRQNLTNGRGRRFGFQEFSFVFMSSPRSHDHGRISESYSEYETMKSVALGMKRREEKRGEERRGVAEEASIWGVQGFG
jgi:hypothetical protein